MFWGIIFIIFGIVIWVLNFLGTGWIWSRDWPFLLIIFGIYKISQAFPRKKKKKNRDLRDILIDIESGKITAEEGLKRMEE